MGMYHYTESGFRNVWLLNGVIHHKTPYGDGISIADVDGLHKVLAHSQVPPVIEVCLVFQWSGDQWRQIV